MKTERLDFSYKPLPEEPTGGLAQAEVFSVPDEDLVSKNVFSRDTFGVQGVAADTVQDTLFRHQVGLSESMFFVPKNFVTT